MARVFVDTSVWVTLVDSRDRRHEAVKEWFRTTRARFVTSSDVFDETVAFANARWGHAVAVRIGAAIKENTEVHFVHVEPEFLHAAWTLFKERPDKGYSLTDCTSFVLMRRMEIEEAWSFDRHFEQEGFRVVPGRD